MTVLNEKGRWARPGLLGALSSGLACSIWALLGTSGCRSCQGAFELLSGHGMAVAGLLDYAVLLLAAALAGPGPVVSWGTLLSAGIHAGLVAVLVHSRLLCPPCVGAAASAALATICVIRLDSANLFRASVLVPAAAMVVQSGLFAAGALGSRSEPQPGSPRPAEEELSAPAAMPGSVRMVVYTRPDCGYCRELEREVLPELLQVFGSRLLVERRSAESLPGIPTPTILLSGFRERRLFPGLPRTELLSRTIGSLMGDDDARQTLPETSR